jgi:hypothetical protein
MMKKAKYKSPRGTGKTTWLKTNLTPKVFINLLLSEQYYRYQAGSKSDSP